MAERDTQEQIDGLRARLAGESNRRHVAVSNLRTDLAVTQRTSAERLEVIGDLRRRTTQLEEALRLASAYTFIPEGAVPPYTDAITVERTHWESSPGPFWIDKAWAIRKRGWCWDEQHEWVQEPLPSSRDEAFLRRCRFHLDDALTLARDLAASTRGERKGSDPERSPK